MAHHKAETMNYEPVIGLEVHVQLKTKTKVFCGCSTEFGSDPNSQVCPVCLGFPGTLPVLNRLALEYSIKAGLALNCTVQEYTKFDRKHYYYPDLPKNLQISQYDLPISANGYLDIELDGRSKRIGIRRAHLEEDAGKLMHKDSVSLVDYNRTGQPLLEIVTEPEISSPEEAYEYLTNLKSIIRYIGVSDCDMEKGSLRCDANISLRPAGTEGLGTKSELKNLNSFKAVRDSLSYEIERHQQLLDDGKKIEQETRLWDDKTGKTLPMRSKEEAKDYRYFPEPDLPPFIINQATIEQIRKSIPELPKEKKLRFMREYGLSDYDAGILVASKETADYSEKRLKAYPHNYKSAANWLIGPLASVAANLNCDISQINIPPENIAELIKLVEEKQVISNLTGKAVLEKMARNPEKSAAAIIQEDNLAQNSDEASLEKEVGAVIRENPKVVAEYKAGKENSIMFLVGQVMKKSQGKANPKVVQEILKRRLLNV
jgi:aspartyl-tRNA(Asn)/glutamyl-tRNA(Gln) amidotransferase subunit B